MQNLRKDLENSKISFSKISNEYNELMRKCNKLQKKVADCITHEESIRLKNLHEKYKNAY
jgi:beta-galactosidase GanA